MTKLTTPEIEEVLTAWLEVNGFEIGYRDPLGNLVSVDLKQFVTRLFYLELGLRINGTID